ncbi:MAG TPA: EVE domain-containing protein [Polyangiales bacterium]|nr:EVE domain-containing protein [Polyangiales bacterium]
MTDRTERKHYWLMKTEPDAFSIDNLAKLGRSPWDGVRSYQARNHMQAMRVGDLVLFYHSSTDDRGVVGLAQVAREAYPDHTQFDPNSKYFDKTAKKAAPRWFMVDVEFVEKFPKLLGLETMKADPQLTDMLVVKRGMRLSVQPVELKHMRRILKQVGARTPL